MIYSVRTLLIRPRASVSVQERHSFAEIVSFVYLTANRLLSCQQCVIETHLTIRRDVNSRRTSPWQLDDCSCPKTIEVFCSEPVSVTESEKTLIGHFLKGVMFWYYHLIDQTIRKNHETYDGRGVQQSLSFQNQPQDYIACSDIMSLILRYRRRGIHDHRNSWKLIQYRYILVPAHLQSGRDKWSRRSMRNLIVICL